MNRCQRHEQIRINQKYVKAVNNLTPVQKEIIESLAIRKATAMVNNMDKVINDCYFTALRTYKVGEIRARKIIEYTNKLMEVEGFKNE